MMYLLTKIMLRIVKQPCVARAAMETVEDCGRIVRASWNRSDWTLPCAVVG
jgi:hypothetical protein